MVSSTLAHAHAICQKTAADQCGRRCTGLGLYVIEQTRRTRSIRATRPVARNNNFGADLFELDVEGEIVVKPLGRRLQFVPPERVSNLVCFVFVLFVCQFSAIVF
jgi:hypothetical protein